MSYPYESEALAAIIEIGRRMYAREMVAANDGNISVMTNPGELWVTPTGVSKGFMREDMLIKINLEGEALEGSGEMSSEVRMHLGVYKANPAIRAVCHAHPPVSTAFAIAGVKLDAAILTEAVISLGEIPVAQYATPGTDEVGNSVAKFANDHVGALMANHGLITWGGSPFEAYFRMEMIEHYAKIAMYSAHIIKRANQLSDKQVEDLEQIRRERQTLQGGGKMLSARSESNMDGFISLPLP